MRTKEGPKETSLFLKKNHYKVAIELNQVKCQREHVGKTQWCPAACHGLALPSTQKSKHQV